MEIAGLGIGAAGISALFKTALEAWEFVDAESSTALNVGYARTRLDNQRIIFLDWSRRLGFFRPEGPGVILAEQERLRQVALTFELLAELFSDTSSLVENYDFKLHSATEGAVAISEPKSSAAFCGKFIRLKEALEGGTAGLLSSSFRAKVAVSQGGTSFWKKTKWLIRDEKKCNEFLRKITDLVDDLDKLTKDFPVSSTDLGWIIESVEELDEESLRQVEEAACDSRSVVSDVASARLKSIEDGARTITTTSGRQTFVTAKTAMSSNIGLADEISAEGLIFCGPAKQGPNIWQCDGQETLEYENFRVPPKLDGEPVEEASGSALDFYHWPVPDAWPEVKQMTNGIEGHYAVRQYDCESQRSLLASFWGPRQTSYEGGIFHIRIDLPRSNKLAEVKTCFHTAILHPNIDGHGNIHVSLLRASAGKIHSRSKTTSDLIAGCVRLLVEPRWPEAQQLQSGCADKEKFDANAREWTDTHALTSPVCTGLCLGSACEGSFAGLGTWATAPNG